MKHVLTILAFAAAAVLVSPPAMHAADPWSYPRSPADLDPALEFVKLNIHTPDGARLAAWYVPGEGRGPAVLVLPGDKDTMSDRLDVLQGLAGRGYRVLTFDLRGRGRSDPFRTDPRAFVVPAYLEDAHSALDILWSRPDVDTTKVAVYGESLGAFLAFALARERPEARAVISVSSPYNAKTFHEVQERHSRSEVRIVPEEWERKHEPEKALDRFRGAVLFVGGELDLLTPAWMAEDLHRRFDRAKELWIVAGASRDRGSTVRERTGAQLYERIDAFLDRELAKAPHKGWPRK